MKVSGVSYSSDRKLSRCEQQYDYRYTQGLRAKSKGRGLYAGDWIHHLLEAYRKKKDWKKEWKRFKKEKWDKLFDEEKEDYGLDFPQLVYDLFEHYVDHYGGDEDWEVVEIEKLYELKTKHGWPIRWKSDFIVRSKSTKKYILVENKNHKKIPEVDARMLAPQTHGYCFLLSKVGIRIDKIVWDYIRTEEVPRPQILKDGSLSKRKLQTDQRGYLKSLKEAGIHPQNEQERIGIENVVKNLPETLSLLRVTNTPNLKLGELWVRGWIERAHRAESIKNPLRTWTKNCKWDCDYFTLCQVDMLGHDREHEIKKNFVDAKAIKPAEEVREEKEDV